MASTTKTRATKNMPFTTIAACMLLAALPSPANADGWELRTSLDAVPGTIEIESGEIDKAIRISKIRLAHVSQQQKVAVLANLCIAYILNKDFDQAEDYCGKAVKQQNDRAVSYNNRGVLKALQGDLDGAVEDFTNASNAGCFGSCSLSSNIPKHLPHAVAMRNSGKAEYLANIAKTGNKGQVAARAD